MIDISRNQRSVDDVQPTLNKILEGVKLINYQPPNLDKVWNQKQKCKLERLILTIKKNYKILEDFEKQASAIESHFEIIVNGKVLSQQINLEKKNNDDISKLNTDRSLLSERK